MKLAARTVVALACTIATTLAQQTLHVSRQDRPGAFRAIQAAVDAATPGDRIVVGPGTWIPPRITKGVDIVGEPGAQLDVGSLVVLGIRAPERCSIVGFQVPDRRPLQLELRHNRGEVHLAHLHVSGTSRSRVIAVKILDCALVTLDDCSSFGAPAVWIERSRVLLTQCEFSGSYTRWDGSAVRAIDATLWITEPRFRGIDDYIGVLAKPALRLENSDVVVVGGPNAYLQGGESGIGVAVVAIGGTGSVVCDPALRLNPFTSSPIGPFSIPLRVTRRPLAAAYFRDGTGPRRTLEVLAPANAFVAPTVSLPADPLVYPGLGTGWVRPASTFLLPAGFSPASGIYRASVELPTTFPRGATLAVQAMLYDASTQRRFLSLPSIWGAR